MKTSRLLAYAAIGMITGLLIENRALLTREHVKDSVHKLKAKIDKKTRKLKDAVES